ncbi:potassium channel family protein [Dyadobacter sp. OTU695]|uniref:potassium channel family protein n=1 Tax=Dyadobacter sp. OTU695 TaxID=3043860 RepID=UPI00313F3BA8
MLKDKIKILLLGNDRPKKDIKPAIQNQIRNLARLWRNETYNDFGIERLYRLFLTIFQFISIGLYVKHISGRFGLLGRKIGVDILVIAKILIPIFLLSTSGFIRAWAPYLVGYLLIDTVIYLNYLIFCSDLNARPITYRRSIINIFCNYIEVALDFSVIYANCNYYDHCFFNRPLHHNFEAVYYSFVTTATVGYGDIFPQTVLAQFLAVTQIVLFFVFVGFLFNFYASKAEVDSYFAKERGSESQQID